MCCHKVLKEYVVRHVLALCFRIGISCFTGRNLSVNKGFAGCVSEGFLACWGTDNGQVMREDMI